MMKKRHKIISRVSEIDYQRLERIAKTYGFRSVYGLQIYVVHCFLRVVDPLGDKSDEVLPEELIRMFPIRNDAKDVYRAIRKVRYRRRRKPESPELFDRKEDPIHDEISELFSEEEDRGRSIEFSDNLRKRSER
jgi:hypothetical protein